LTPDVKTAMASERKQRVALIGVDAAELNYIRAHLADLRNFRRALDDGRMVELRSQFEAFPGAVWPSFFTGQNAGDHGFYLIQGLRQRCDCGGLRRMVAAPAVLA
jgi:predicted AlkP superfamily phosphohydrolase/phosphomutase